jgi:hypothetical protein
MGLRREISELIFFDIEGRVYLNWGFLARGELRNSD